MRPKISHRTISRALARAVLQIIRNCLYCDHCTFFEEEEFVKSIQESVPSKMFFLFSSKSWPFKQMVSFYYHGKTHPCGPSPFWTMADKWAGIVSAPAWCMSSLGRCEEASLMKWAPHYPACCSRNQSYSQRPCLIQYNSATIRGEVRK